MKIAVATSILVLLTAAAQAQQSDTQQILKLLQDLNGRFDQVEKRLDALEGTLATTPPVNAASAPSPATTPASPPATAVAGWKIDVFPYAKDDFAKIPIFRGRVPAGEINLSHHMSKGNVYNYVMYVGKAYFSVVSPGDYSFKMTASRGHKMNCFIKMEIEGRVIIDFSDSESITQFGGAKLDPGMYELTHYMGCKSYLDNWNGSMSDEGAERYKSMNYNISVLGPNDSEFREFGDKELYYN